MLTEAWYIYYRAQHAEHVGEAYVITQESKQEELGSHLLLICIPVMPASPITPNTAWTHNRATQEPLLQTLNLTWESYPKEEPTEKK